MSSRHIGPARVVTEKAKYMNWLWSKFVAKLRMQSQISSPAVSDHPLRRRAPSCAVVCKAGCSVFGLLRVQSCPADPEFHPTPRPVGRHAGDNSWTEGA